MASTQVKPNNHVSNDQVDNDQLDNAENFVTSFENLPDEIIYIQFVNKDDLTTPESK